MTAFEAAPLIKPPALRRVADFFSRVSKLYTGRLRCLTRLLLGLGPDKVFLDTRQIQAGHIVAFAVSRRLLVFRLFPAGPFTHAIT